MFTNLLGLTPRFPAFAGEGDFSLRIRYFLLIVLPAFFVLGAWIGHVFSTCKRVAGYMAIGVLGGTVIAFSAVSLLSYPFTPQRA